MEEDENCDPQEFILPDGSKIEMGNERFIYTEKIFNSYGDLDLNLVEGVKQSL